MKHRETVFVALFSAFAATPALFAASPIDAALAQSRGQGTQWLSWLASATPEVGFVCCLEGLQRGRPGQSCKVEDRNQGWSTSSQRREHDPELRVLVRVRNGEVERVVAYSRSCPLELKSPVRELEVETRAGLEFLRGVARTKADDDGNQALAAVALHADPFAGRILEELSAPGQPAKLREDAIFWTGQTRGEPGVAYLKSLFGREADGEIREKILFSLSQTGLESAHQTLADATVKDRDPEVRGQACFWLAQSGAGNAAEAIQHAIESDETHETRKKCVFALSQLPDNGTDALIALVRASRDKDIRREALFWLGQSDDPRALDVISQLLRE